jgi:hypothetical protein
MYVHSPAPLLPGPMSRAVAQLPEISTRQHRSARVVQSLPLLTEPPGKLSDLRIAILVGRLARWCAVALAARAITARIAMTGVRRLTRCPLSRLCLGSVACAVSDEPLSGQGLVGLGRAPLLRSLARHHRRVAQDVAHRPQIARSTRNRSKDNTHLSGALLRGSGHIGDTVSRSAIRESSGHDRDVVIGIVAARIEPAMTFVAKRSAGSSACSHSFPANSTARRDGRWLSRRVAGPGCRVYRTPGSRNLRKCTAASTATAASRGRATLSPNA